MTVDIFCYRVHDDIGAEFKRVLEIRAHERVVDDQECAMTVCLLGHSADIDEAEGRVCRGLDPNKLGVGLEATLDIGWVVQINKIGLNLELACDFGKVAISAAIDIVDGDNVRAGAERLYDARGYSGA
ncbi:hypothetical protein BC937DRAFT_89129 [Endogone sp. FLAS-F59071]|nr:hypothetical protein BC937DRAFT_89129 [Endogone sp. FLAS-F59071]|eukprot:RUS18122.1 hypothetical protein BC937DRAFT_89129 [Endogone sp. FLAS-F59071]